MRTTFEADIVYVALHDRARRRDRLPLLQRARARRADQDPLALGRGLTSRILTTREPLLLNRDAHFSEVAGPAVGTPAKSFLGVPILVGDEAIGVDQRPEHAREGRFGEADVRLLSTIAANVGVAIQNARLYRETHRRADEMAALADVGAGDLGHARPDRRSSSRSPSMRSDLLAAETSAVFLAEPDGRTFRAIVGTGRLAEADPWPTRSRSGEGIIGERRSRRAEPSSSTTSRRDPRTGPIPGTDPDDDRSGSWSPR